MLSTVLFVLQIILSLLLIVLILMQPDRGDSLSSAEAIIGLEKPSQTFFGSRGSAAFITKLTAVIAFALFTTTLGLNLVYNRINSDDMAALTEPSPVIATQSRES